MKNGAIVLALSLAACTQNLADYRPVVDPQRTNMTKFENDLVQCRSIAITAKANYDKQASKAAAVNVLAGVVVGAAVGSTVGANSGYQGEMTRFGATQGAAVGALSSNDYASVAKYGPSRIIDRCMANRGYAILNDVGLGTN